MSDQQTTNAEGEQSQNLAEQAAEAAEGAQTEEAKQDQDSGTSEELLDLDGLDKFKFQGQEFTPEEINKAMLRQSDYTRKTQALAEEKKYMDNLFYDLQNVRKNPELADQFKQIYPEKYHASLEFVLNNGANTEAGREEEPDIVETLQAKIEQLESKLGEVDKKFYDENVQAVQQKLDATFDRLNTKYDLADEDAVINKAQRLIEENKENPNFQMTEAAWERLFRADHETREKLFNERQKKLLEKQAEQGKRAVDGGAGGAAPGRAPRRMSFDEATEMAIQDLSRQG